MQNWIYHFNNERVDGSMHLKNVLGGKGASLAEIAKLNLPIPPGFTISTEVCKYYYSHNHTLPANFYSELDIALEELERVSGKTLGVTHNPLLLSVRSGASDSMPGMMDTILNLGMNEEVFAALSAASKNLKFALDSYKRFLQMYGTIVLDIPSYSFGEIIELQKSNRNIEQEAKFSEEILAEVIDKFKKLIIDYKGSPIPSDPKAQLIDAIKAVLNSWMSKRAIAYREIHRLTDNMGTAVNIQSMVYGNMGADSATGVVFTRNPSTGHKESFGEFLVDAQGEDVVAGIRTPVSIVSSQNEELSMKEQMPELYDQLIKYCNKLEHHYRDMQDVEFTIEKGKLYILQSRNAKRTVYAAIKVAVDLVGEGLIDKQDAIMRIDPASLTQLLHSNIDYSNDIEPIGKGLAASPGAASGIVVFSSYEAEELSHYYKVILVRGDTSPEDIKGMYVASGVLTARGGMTSHAAVVARGMGKPCVCGVSKMSLDEHNKQLKIGNVIIKAGEEITIDGSTGKIFLSKVKLVEPILSAELNTILCWADEISHLKVRANAENIPDTKAALKFEAAGIGLCRTEHMFFDKDKIPLIQEMIIVQDEKRRKEALEKLLSMQLEDFKELFKMIKDKSINIRLLDPPLHEFLPKTRIERENLASRLNISVSFLEQRLEALHEVNPMLGHRGCRLGIVYPEIYKMQVQAIGLAAAKILQQEKTKVNLEIMIPFISNVNELKIIKEYIAEVLSDKVNYSLGTMIELPRAALIAGKIAQYVNFFSFGTNDLTQTTYGLSRDDMSSFLPEYLEQKIMIEDPFAVVDQEGVGELIKIAIERGRAANPNLKLGVCGEHAGNPQSIEFFHKIGVDYISCSPYRIPIAKLAAAQAKLNNNTN